MIYVGTALKKAPYRKVMSMESVICTNMSKKNIKYIIIDFFVLVRNTVAFSIAAIAHWDWPDHWPHLFEILMQVILISPRGGYRIYSEVGR